jgi:hypothetical protein
MLLPRWPQRRAGLCIVTMYFYYVSTLCVTIIKGVDDMPATEERGKEATLNLRVDAELKAEFVSAVEAEERPAAEVLRALMRNYVEEARRRRFAAEARRQSQLVAASKDEAEVMRWIQDVSALEGER